MIRVIGVIIKAMQKFNVGTGYVRTICNPGINNKAGVYFIDGYLYAKDKQANKIDYYRLQYPLHCYVRVNVMVCEGCISYIQCKALSHEKTTLYNLHKLKMETTELKTTKVDYSDLPQNRYFVITREFLSPGSEFQDATKQQVNQIKKDGFTVAFRLFDDDGIHYYSGYLKTKYEGCEQAFRPLEDYGMPNAGCTDIKYLESDKKWHSL